MLRQILADLAALGRDIGETARRQDTGGGKQTERMAAMDHDGIRYGQEDGGDDGDDIVVKQ